MTRKAVTAKSAETLAAAASKMKAGKFRRLPVADADKLVGIVSEFDLKRYEDVLDSTLVESAMTRDPITVMPSETLQYAAALMHQHEVGALPVIQGGKVVGNRYRKKPHDARTAANPRMGSAPPPLRRAPFTFPEVRRFDLISSSGESGGHVACQFRYLPEAFKCRCYFPASARGFFWSPQSR
jgi:CBS-domain-containing membrane protein